VPAPCFGSNAQLLRGKECARQFQDYVLRSKTVHLELWLARKRRARKAKRRPRSGPASKTHLRELNFAAAAANRRHTASEVRHTASSRNDELRSSLATHLLDLLHGAFDCLCGSV
jgi:hypothetical protein